MFSELFLIFIDVVAPVFFIVLAGYIAKPLLELDAKSLNHTAYYFFVPSFVFSTMSQAQISLQDTFQMTSYIILVHLVLAFSAYFLAKLFRRNRKKAVAYAMIGIFGNVGNYGLSIVIFHLGETARVPATLFFLTIITLSFIVCEGLAGWTKGGGLNGLLSVFKTPALLAFIPALPFAVTHTAPPLFISRISGLLGNAMIPVMLFTLGVQLANVKKIRINFDVIAASTIRLLGGPLVAFFLASFFSLDEISRGAGILQSAMPAAVLTSIIAIKHDLLPDFVTTTVMFSTLFSLVTLTVLMAYF